MYVRLGRRGAMGAGSRYMHRSQPGPEGLTKDDTDVCRGRTRLPGKAPQATLSQSHRPEPQTYIHEHMYGANRQKCVWPRLCVWTLTYVLIATFTRPNAL